MTTKSLKQAFNTVFHDPALFDDFLNANLSADAEQFLVGRHSEQKIVKSSEKLTKILKFIDKVILPYLTINKAVVHSYVKDRSTSTAVKAHVSNHCFFTTDIQNFFGNISLQDVLDVLKINAGNIPVSDIEDYIPRIAQLMCLDKYLPIGFPTSPKISNAVLYDFDVALEGYCLKNNLIYTRYSDDLIISGQSRESLTALKSKVQHYLSKHSHGKLTINESKTHLYTLGQSFTLLGLVMTQYGKLTIQKEQKNVLELALHYFVNDPEKYRQHLERSFTGKKDKERALYGMIHYAKSVSPEYLGKLKQKYGAYAVASLMENKWHD